MAMQVTNQIAGYNISLMSDSFGWIELIHGINPVGYVYFSKDPLPKDRIGNRENRDGRPSYVVMHQYFSSLQIFIDILKNEPNLTIRLSEEMGGDAFLESSTHQINSSEEEPFRKRAG
jgi:hypothetical protein